MTDRAQLFMRDTDAFSWYLEKDPSLRATIVAVAWLDQRPDFDLLSARPERATGEQPAEPLSDVIAGTVKLLPSSVGNWEQFSVGVVSCFSRGGDGCQLALSGGGPASRVRPRGRG